MSAFLLTWNPGNHIKRNGNFKDLAAIAQHFRDEIPGRWSSGNAKPNSSSAIPIGARVFLLRQGNEPKEIPKGIVASGWVTQGTYEDKDEDQKSPYFVKFVADALLGPTNDPLDVRVLLDELVNTRFSGRAIPITVAEKLSKAWAEHVGTAHGGLVRVDPQLVGMEGDQRLNFVNHRLRERALREAKLQQAREKSLDGRARCEVPRCNFDFEAVYGHRGAGFAHVHHVRPLAEALYPRVTTLEDLAVVCANCHAIIHRDGACHPIETLIPALDE